jgi:enterochelin esterase-like enzyme
MLRSNNTPRGTIHRLQLQSDVLAGNLLEDPSLREIAVYTPHGHDGRELPLLVDLVGFTAGGPAHVNWKNFGENLPERLDRLIATGVMTPCVVAFPDCFTKLGGNQYINSSAMGRWDDFLLKEAVPFIELTFGCGGTGRRGVFGKSSGGYGAMVHALLHPDFWSAAAVHSGDSYFEISLKPDFAHLLRALAKHGGSIEKWLEAFWENPKPKDRDVHDLMTLAMCASYDPDPSDPSDPSAPYGVRLPVSRDTCEFIPERWANFIAWDPVTLVETHGSALKRLKALYIDCGDVDQYNLVYGARRIHARLDAMGVSHVYQEFPDDHSSVDYRMDISLPMLAKALT